MSYHEFPSLVIANRIRRLHLALQGRRAGRPTTQSVTVNAIDLEYVLDHLDELEKYKTHIEGLFEAEIIS